VWFNGTTFQTWDNAALDDAVYGGTAGTVTLGGVITVHNLNFTTTGYTLTGGGTFVSILPMRKVTLSGLTRSSIARHRQLHLCLCCARRSDEHHDDDRANDNENKSADQHWEQTVIRVRSAFSINGTRRLFDFSRMNHGPSPFERVGEACHSTRRAGSDYTFSTLQHAFLLWRFLDHEPSDWRYVCRI
jgi:hypothetical protein